jgi:hypothetical protein
MGNLFSLKAVPDGVRSELNARSTVKGVEWVAKRFPWIRVSSMSSACTKYGILHSATNGTIGMSYSGEEGYRPQPVVDSVSVKKQGELGTTRTCTVSIKAFTDAQLVELQKCFFIPGMTVRVQWGWSVAATGAKSPSPVDGPLPDSQAVCQMQKTAGSSAIYDGMQGLVTNFSYKLAADGYWDCSFEMVAATEAVGGGKVATYNEECDCTRTFKVQGEDGESKDATEKKSLLHTFFFDVNADASEGDSSFSIYKSKLASSLDSRFGQPVIAGGNYEGEDRDASGGSAQSAWSLGNYDTTEGYISWRTLEAAINRYALPTNGGKYILGRVASQDLLVKGHPKLESGDPRICVIPGSPELSAAIGAGNWIWRGTPPSVWNASEFDFGGIMLNCIFLMQELKAVEDGDNKIHTFLTNVLKKVSNACGGYFTDMLEIVSTTEDCANPVDVPTISIIDLRKYKAVETYRVPSKPGNSVIRDLKLDMQLTGAMKTQALYSNGKKQNAKGAKCDTIGFKPFGLADDGSIRDRAKLKANTPPPCDCEETPQQGKSEKKSQSEIFEEMYACVDNGTTGAAVSSVADEVNGGDDVTEKCAGVPLPFDFGFTCDGVGGLAFGQTISSDRIPSEIASKFDFQITTVEHEINVQDWTTSVSTVARFKA